jgi:hypothetical protein
MKKLNLLSCVVFLIHGICNISGVYGDPLFSIKYEDFCKGLYVRPYNIDITDAQFREALMPAGELGANAGNIAYLDLFRCTQLSIFPDLSRFSSLIALNFGACINLKDWSNFEVLNFFPFLELLDLSWTPVNILPKWISACSNLRSLNLCHTPLVNGIDEDIVGAASFQSEANEYVVRLLKVIWRKENSYKRERDVGEDVEGEEYQDAAIAAKYAKES